MLPGVVAWHLPSIPWFLGVWFFGGCVALTGALCFAELTTTYPDAGGDYGYLKRAYHPRLAFAFSWTAFWVIRPGNIGAMAMIFGKFGVTLLEQFLNISGQLQPLWLGIGVTVFITVLNGLGVVFSKTAQNCLTTAKVVGILLVLGGALMLAVSNKPVKEASQTVPSSENLQNLATDQPSANLSPPSTVEKTRNFSWGSFWMAMVFVMFVFGGWNDVAFVATEVEEPRKNLLKSLVIGTMTVLALYLLVNLSLLAGLGIRELADLGSRFENPTAIFIQRTVGAWGATLFSGLVCVSCLGSINAMIFTSPRIYWATAQDFPALSELTGSSADRKGWRAMTLQCIVTMMFMLGLGRQDGGIDNLVAATAPYFWFFLGLTVMSLVVNRARHSEQFDGFRVPLYPGPPLLFVTACVFMAYQAMSYLLERSLVLTAFVIGLWVAAGVATSFFVQRKDRSNRGTTAT